MLNRGFSFDGIDSDTYGISIVRLDGGLTPVPYVSSKDIIEEYPTKAMMPYFFGVKSQPLTFSLTFTCIDQDMDAAKLSAIGNWLFQRNYKPFISDDNTSKIYYCMAVNQSEFYTADLTTGYFTVEFRCRDAYGWSLPSIQDFNLSTAATPTLISLSNTSNVGYDYYYPILEITMRSTDTAITLTNITDGNRVFQFTNLSVGESLYVDNQKKILTSDTENYRFSNFNKNWLRLLYGDNDIEVNGKCSLRVKMQFPIF